MLIEPLTTVDQVRPLEAGRTYYVDDPFPVRASFAVSEGWEVWAYTHAATQVNVVKGGVGEMSLEIVENVIADPCTTEQLDPPVGPSVEDLVRALSNLREFGFDVSPATDITIDGFRGKQLTLESPSSAPPGCDGWLTWRTTTRQNGVGPSEVNEVRVLDVDGVRLVISTAHGAYVAAEARAELDTLAGSLEISD